MKANKLMSTASIALSFLLSACSSSPGKDDLSAKITGKYAQQGENEFDYFKDTLEVRALEDGKFDVATVAIWSAAKKSDPQRPFNKVAGVWNNQGAGKTVIAELQAKDTTLRITEPMSGAVTILHIDIDKRQLHWPARDGGESVYTKGK